MAIVISGLVNVIDLCPSNAVLNFETASWKMLGGGGEQGEKERCRCMTKLAGVEGHNLVSEAYTPLLSQ